MSEEELLKLLMESYENEMASRNDSDYEVNEVQFRKLSNAYGFFSELVEKNNGTIEELKLTPKEVNGGITAYFTLLYVSGDDILRLSKVVGNMGTLSIDSTVDGEVCISFTIPGVFYKK